MNNDDYEWDEEDTADDPAPTDIISVEPCGDHVIGPTGLFIVLTDTYQEAGGDSELIKVREITPEENAALRQFIIDNNLTVDEDKIGWTVTGYYG